MFAGSELLCQHTHLFLLHSPLTIPGDAFPCDVTPRAWRWALPQLKSGHYRFSCPSPGAVLCCAGWKDKWPYKVANVSLGKLFPSSKCHSTVTSVSFQYYCCVRES